MIAIRPQNEVPNKNYVFPKWVAQVGFMTLGLLTYTDGIKMLRTKKEREDFCSNLLDQITAVWLPSFLKGKGEVNPSRRLPEELDKSLEFERQSGWGYDFPFPPPAPFPCPSSLPHPSSRAGWINFLYKESD